VTTTACVCVCVFVQSHAPYYLCARIGAISPAAAVWRGPVSLPALPSNADAGVGGVAPRTHMTPPATSSTAAAAPYTANPHRSSRRTFSSDACVTSSQRPGSLSPRTKHGFSKALPPVFVFVCVCVWGIRWKHAEPESQRLFARRGENADDEHGLADRQDLLVHLLPAARQRRVQLQLGARRVHLPTPPR
jgi:hypothetical protein